MAGKRLLSPQGDVVRPMMEMVGPLPPPLLEIFVCALNIKHQEAAGSKPRWIPNTAISEQNNIRRSCIQVRYVRFWCNGHAEARFKS